MAIYGLEYESNSILHAAYDNSPAPFNVKIFKNMVSTIIVNRFDQNYRVVKKLDTVAAVPFSLG